MARLERIVSVDSKPRLRSGWIPGRREGLEQLCSKHCSTPLANIAPKIWSGILRPKKNRACNTAKAVRVDVKQEESTNAENSLEAHRPLHGHHAHQAQVLH